MKTSSFAMIPVVLLALASPAWSQTATLPAAPTAPAANTTVVVPDGIVWHLGRPYLIHNGRAAVINQALVPDGHLLTADGRLLPLPADFGGFDPIIPATAETVLPAVVPPAPPSVNVVGTTTFTGGTSTPAGVRVNATPTRPAFMPPHATIISDNGSIGNMGSTSTPAPVTYYRPVGAVSARSGLRTYPGSTAATITNGSTRASSGIPAGSTFARVAGSSASRAGRLSTKATTVHTR